jgi:hypothetical protein
MVSLYSILYIFQLTLIKFVFVLYKEFAQRARRASIKQRMQWAHGSSTMDISNLGLFFIIFK